MRAGAAESGGARYYLKLILILILGTKAAGRIRSNVNRRAKTVTPKIREYNKQVVALPEGVVKPPMLDETKVHELIQNDSDLWELDRFTSNEKWAKDSKTLHAVSVLATLQRAQEELFILASDCERFISWHTQKLDEIDCTLSLLLSNTILHDHLLERGARSLYALEELPYLEKTANLLIALRPAVPEFQHFKGTSLTYLC